MVKEKNSREQLKASNRDPTKQLYKKERKKEIRKQAGPVEQEQDMLV
jgi:hypothetical protein